MGNVELADNVEVVDFDFEAGEVLVIFDAEVVLLADSLDVEVVECTLLLLEVLE